MKKFLPTITIILTFSSAIFSQIPTEGLVGYWPFNGNANDESVNSNNGAVDGATLTEDRFDDLNSAYSFDGVGNKILIDGHAGTLTFDSDEQFSISLWFIIPGYPSYHDFIYDHKNATRNGIMAAVAPDGYIISNFEGNTNGVNYGLVSQDTLTPDKWYHLVVLYDGINKTAELYLNSTLNDTVNIGEDLVGPIGNNSIPVTFGYRSGLNEPTHFEGKIDDVAVYDRLLTLNEIRSISSEDLCSDTVTGDTTIIYVADNGFDSISPQVYLQSTDTFYTEYGCDSIIRHFTKYVFEASYCTDTLTVYDTITVYDSIAVTDTLIIDAVLTGIDPPHNINTLKIYPNPAKDYIHINTGDYAKMDGYQLKIINQLGATEFETLVEEPLYEINLSSWSGPGLYFVQVIDNGGEVIDTRKIILQ